MAKMKTAIIVLALGLLLVTCKSVNQVDITEKVSLRSSNCYEQYLDLRLDTIKIMYPNKEKTKDYISLRPGLELVVSITNNDFDEKKVVFEDEFKSRFFGISQNDTIEFRKFTSPTTQWLQPNDSISIGLSDYFFNFYSLAEECSDIEKEMIDFLSNFKLIYFSEDSEKLCIRITRKTTVITKYYP
jgi:hypothetical protein